MRATRTHTRIIQQPFATLMQGALLNSYAESELDLVLEVDGLHVLSSELLERDEKLYERIEGEYIPLQIRFSNITKLHRPDFFSSLKEIAEYDPVRTIEDMLSWQQPGVSDIFHIVGLRSPVDAGMDFFARKVMGKKREDSSTRITFERDWSPAPPMPDRLIPRPNSLYRRFGGDPINVRIGDDWYRQRLFIGGLDVQSADRPQVDAVLNLGEEASRWVKGQSRHFNDRRSSRGEGANGMTLAEICEEADWVIEHLKNNQRVLVHCVAGMNRSTTICCAVLIRFEGLSAEAALERVREHHPWARPDPHHWLALRWLAAQGF